MVITIHGDIITGDMVIRTITEGIILITAIMQTQPTRQEHVRLIMPPKERSITAMPYEITPIIRVLAQILQMHVLRTTHAAVIR
jgi:hypothetical protein